MQWFFQRYFLLVVFAFWLISGANAGPSAATSYKSPSDIKCGSDDACRLIYRVEIRNLTVSGVTGSALATWATSDGTPNGTTANCPSTPDNQLYIRPAVTPALTGCFVVDRNNPAINTPYDFFCDGVTDVRPAIVAAIAARPNGGRIVSAGNGACILSTGSTIAIPYSGITFDLYSGPFQPASQPASSDFFAFTVAPGVNDVSFDCHNSGAGFNGISAAYNKWQLISDVGYSAPTSGEGFSKNFRLANCSIQHVNINSAHNGGVLYFVGTDGTTVENNTFYDVGLTSSFSGGGFSASVWGSQSRNFKAINNKASSIGETFLYITDGYNTLIHGNSCAYATLFCYKSGYGAPVAVTSSVTPTTTTFSIANTGNAAQAFISGKFIEDVEPAAGANPPSGYIASVVNNGTYLTITLSEPLAAALTVGTRISTIETGNVTTGNSTNWSGNDSVDYNTMKDAIIANNTFNNCGYLKISGSYFNSGAGTPCLWVGADPIISSANNFSDNIAVTSNVIGHSKNGGIQLYTPIRNSIIANNTISDWGYDRDALNSAAPVTWGIDIPASYNRGSGNSILGNVLTSTYGGGIKDGYTSGDVISGNKVTAGVGVDVRYNIGTVVHNNVVTATSNSSSAYGVGIFPGPFGGQNTSGVKVKSNTVSLSGGVGYGLYLPLNGDGSTGPSGIAVYSDNSFEGAGITQLGGTGFSGAYPAGGGFADSVSVGYNNSWTATLPRYAITGNTSGTVIVNAFDKGTVAKFDVNSSGVTYAGCSGSGCASTDFTASLDATTKKIKITANGAIGNTSALIVFNGSAP